MDRAVAGGSFFRRVTPIFLFISARDLWRNGGHVGDVFLQLRTAQCFRRAFIHAGCAFTQSRPRRAIFLPALDQQRQTDIVFRSCDRHLVCTADQTSERSNRRATSVSRLPKMALEFSETTVPLAFRRDYNLTFNCVVLACVPRSGEILSASFLPRRPDSAIKLVVVHQHPSPHHDLQPT